MRKKKEIEAIADTLSPADAAEVLLALFDKTAAFEIKTNFHSSLGGRIRIKVVIGGDEYGIDVNLDEVLDLSEAKAANLLKALRRVLGMKMFDLDDLDKLD